MNTKTTMERMSEVKAKASQYLESFHAFRASLNPPQFEERALAIFRGNTEGQKLMRDGFEDFETEYGTIGVTENECSMDLREEVEKLLGRSLRVSIRLFIAIPKALLEATRPTKVKIAIRFHGGGGMTGHPRFPDWQCRADLEYILANDMVSVDPTYCLMPEASSNTQLENLKSLREFLFTSLESKLQEFNPFFTVDWNHIYLFGISFGAWMAMGFWLEIGRQSKTPPETRVRALVLRCPVIQEYSRDAGEYMGYPITKERADMDSANIWSARERLSFVLHRAGSHPPDGMYGSHTFAVGHRFGEFLGQESMFDMIRETDICPDIRTRICILHGTADQHVPFRCSQEVQKLFKSKQWQPITLVAQEGKDHAWDYRESLTEELQQFLDLSAR